MSYRAGVPLVALGTYLSGFQDLPFPLDLPPLF
jgi:hypothetical protein